MTWDLKAWCVWCARALGPSDECVALTPGEVLCGECSKAARAALEAARASRRFPPPDEGGT